MSDRRRARRAKQSRRDERRAKKRDEESSADTTFTDALRRALGRHPLGLLSIASMMIQVAKPDSLTSPESDANYLDQILAGLIDTRNRETTALLAVIAELLVDDPEPQLRCRREVAERGEHLPRWIGALSRVEVYRAVRRTYVFGDVDELVIGMRLDGGHELTVAVRIDHNMSSSVVDAGAVSGPIDQALAQVAERSSDTSVFDMALNDARTWIEDALNKPTLRRRLRPGRSTVRSFGGWWIGCQRAVNTGHRQGTRSRTRSSATRSSLPVPQRRSPNPVIERCSCELFESGTGDPLRWSAARVERAIGDTPYLEESFPLEVVLDAPDLLRAFIPFAHAQSRIREELTSRTLAAIDELRSSFKREVLREADYWWLDDAV